MAIFYFSKAIPNGYPQDPFGNYRRRPAVFSQKSSRKTFICNSLLRGGFIAVGSTQRLNRIRRSPHTNSISHTSRKPTPPDLDPQRDRLAFQLKSSELKLLRWNEELGVFGQFPMVILWFSFTCSDQVRLASKFERFGLHIFNFDSNRWRSLLCVL